MTCPNCSAELTGDLCSNCEYNHPGGPKRLNLFELLSTRLLKLDYSYLRTVVGIFQAPGIVAREYVQGRRIWYTNPVTYWLVAATLQLVAFSTVGDSYVDYLETSMTYTMELDSPQAAQAQEGMEVYKKLFRTDEPIPVLAQVMASVTRAGYSYVGIFFAAAFAFALTLFTRTATGSFRVAEQFVFALYTIGHWLLVTAFLLPITFRISPGLHFLIGTMGYLVLAGWGSVDFHQQGMRGALRSTAAMFAAVLLYMVVMLVVMMVFIFAKSLAS
ncbi:MAG: hypothetical protein ACI80V_003261 [Rhodothermales bacterium]|jgi:hypothetical protein